MLKIEFRVAIMNYNALVNIMEIQLQMVITRHLQKPIKFGIK